MSELMNGTSDPAGLGTTLQSRKRGMKRVRASDRSRTRGCEVTRNAGIAGRNVRPK